METIRVALVTGASSGLGRAFAEAVLRDRPDMQELWVVARRLERLQELAREHPDRTVRCIAADLADERGLLAVDDELRRRQPSLALLVNNAGIEGDGRFWEVEKDRMKAMMRLNAEAPMTLCYLAIPYMKRGAQIINVSSTAGFCPLPAMTEYSATKAFLTTLTEGLRAELRPLGINALALCPGNMDTEMNPAERPVGGDSGTQSSRLPFVSCELIARRALERSSAGRGFYTPGAFYKAYRLAMKLVPHNVARAVSPRFF